jgi:hypothetical protein
MSRPSQGAAWLDKQAPAWFKRIKRPVDIASYTDCIGGQFSGEFGVFVDKYFRNKKTGVVDMTSLVRLGFQTRELEAKPEELVSLNSNWNNEIERRVAAASVKKEPAIV